MAGKRTNDSVDRILQDLNDRQTRDSVRSSVSDQQVDDILRSVGLSDLGAPLGPLTMDSTVDDDELDALLSDLPSVQSMRGERPVQPAPQPIVPEEEADEVADLAPRFAPELDDAPTGDTTNTGIIKNFLLKMAPEGAEADTAALNEGKNQFQKFFKDSVAVVPDENGRLREPGKKKRGLFGMASAEETDEFVPINVSLGSDAPAKAPDPIPAEEEPEHAAPKKRGLFGLFGRREEPEETPAPAPAEPQPASGEDTGAVLRSKYTAARRAQSEPEQGTGFEAPDLTGGITLGGSTLELLRDAIASKPAPKTTQTSTVYRKKRDTVEFIPGQKSAPKAPEAPAAEPEGEPLNAVSTYTSTGFTIAMDPLDPLQTAPSDSTQEFMAAFSAVRAGRTAPAEPGPAPAPAEPDPEDTARMADALADAVLAQTRGDITGTMTGQIKLDLSGLDAPKPAAEPAKPAAQPTKQDFVNNIAASINAQPTMEMPALSHYDDAAAKLLGSKEIQGENASEETASVKLKKVADRIRLSGVPDDEKDGAGEHPFTEELPRVTGGPRYETENDIPEVRKALDKQVFELNLTVLFTAVLGAALLYLGIGAAGALPMPAPLDPLTAPTALLTVALVLLLVCAGLCWRTLKEGVLGLFKEPTPDSMPVLALLGAAAQLICFLVKPAAYDPVSHSLMAGPAALLLCFNTMGKALDARSLLDGFGLVSAKVSHSVAYRLKDAAVLRAVTRGLAEPRPSVLVSRPTPMYKNFLQSAKAHRTSDKNQQQFAWLLGGCALLSLLIILLRDKDAANAVTAMAAVLVLGAPLAGTLLSALPAHLMQRSAAQVGAVIPGWKDIRQLGRINVIQVTARDLFPAGCVTLCGINPVYKERIDLAIVYAASLLAEGSTILRDIFLGMIGNDKKLLAKVEGRESIYGKGCVGWIKGERILVGNRALMADYGIKLPGLEYEQRHTVNQRRVIYLAVSGKLFAMFQVAYQRDPDTAAVLDSLRRTGLSLIVDCDDFNVDANLLETAYSLPSGAVKVLDAQEREALAPATAWLPESEGNMLHLGSFASFVGGLEAAAGAAAGERKAAAAMNLSVLLTCALSIILAFSAGFAKVALPYIVLYQAAWAVLALIFPMFQQY